MHALLSAFYEIEKIGILHSMFTRITSNGGRSYLQIVDFHPELSRFFHREVSHL